VTIFSVPKKNLKTHVGVEGEPNTNESAMGFIPAEFNTPDLRSTFQNHKDPGST